MTEPRTTYTGTTSTGQIAKHQTERRLTDKYHELHRLIDAMGKALLEMMRHPDATNEQLDEARLKYFIAYAKWIDARMELRKRYPGPALTQLELPWNTREL